MINRPESQIISYTLTESNNILSIDALIRDIQPDVDAMEGVSSGWLAMEALLEFFLPVVGPEHTEMSIVQDGICVCP